MIVVACHAGAQPLTLGEARRIAEAANPALRAATADLYAAEGQVAESAHLLWNNPALSLEGARRVLPQAGAPEQRVREWGVGLAQPFEIAGQQRFRREAAGAELDALQANIAEVRGQLFADVEERFVKLLAVQARIGVERENLRLVEEASSAIGKRVAAGETSKLQGNIARVEAERARNQLAQLDEAIVQARAELAVILQLPPGARPEAQGGLPVEATYSRDVLLESALRRRQLLALELREKAARSRLSLERAAATPDVTVGVNMAREGPPDLRENVVGLTVSVPLPIFRRNEGAIGRAMTGLTQAQIERQAAERDVRATVESQWERVENLRVRADRLSARVVPLLEENLRLSRRAFQEGEIALPELLVVNRQVVDARREMLEAQAELRLARIALERAAGWNPEAVNPIRKDTSK